jgi:hypothetical protein
MSDTKPIPIDNITPVSISDVINEIENPSSPRLEIIQPVQDGRYEIDQLSRQCKECKTVKLLNEFRRNSARCRVCLQVRCHIKIDGKECGLLLSDERSLQRHIASVHDKLKPHMCSECGFKCSQKGNLRHHVCRNLNDGCGYIREDIYQREVERETGGRMTKCNGGVVDVVSCIEVIEIKHWIRWKDAIGEVTVYALDFPEKKKRIHFYGKRPDQKVYDYIHSVCKRLDIIVTETSIKYESNVKPPSSGGETTYGEPILQALAQSHSNLQRGKSVEGISAVEANGSRETSSRSSEANNIDNICRETEERH